MKERKTPRGWYREINTRTMSCVLCGNKIPPLTKILTAHFRGVIVICNDCEIEIPQKRLEIYEYTISGNLPHSPNF